MSRTPERGSALLVTMIIVAALLGGAAALVSIQNGSMRSVELQRQKISAHYCAEAGLTATRNIVATHYAQWNASLGTNVEPSWLASVNHDLDNNGTNDFTVTLRDNQDELTGTDDPTHDNDLTVYVVSTCDKFSEMPVQLVELVRFNGGGNCYQAQIGGCGGNSNAN